MRISSVSFIICHLLNSAQAHGDHHDHHHHHHDDEDLDINLRGGGRSLVANDNAPEWVINKTKDTKFKNKNGKWEDGVRCSTPNKKEDPFQRRLVEEMIDAHVNGDRRLEGGDINTAYHVICCNGNCAATQKMVDDQHNVLNSAFAATGFSFVNVETKFVDDCDHYNQDGSVSKEMAMKNAHAHEPCTTMNVYVANLGGGLLGWARFPNEQDECHKVHGVVVLGGSLTGGYASPYNLGDTLVHEVGHAFGLYHTFQGGCNGQGDSIADTPYERSPAYGCPIGRDTCKKRGQTGTDPVQNYMDYSDDSCMDHFTSDQTARMLAMIAQYRPSLMGSSQPTTTSATTTTTTAGATQTSTQAATGATTNGCDKTPVGGSCTKPADCCSNKCKGKPENMTCK